MTTDLDQTVATPQVKKTTTKSAPKAAAKVATKVAGIATEKKADVAKGIKAEIKKVTTEVKKDAQKVASKVKTAADASTVTKVIETGKKTTKILSTAGEKLFNNSIKSTKAIASIYTKVGKKAITLGKDLFNETSKVMADNQKVMKDTSIKAIKEAVETIQESHIIEFPFKKK
jgi:hypothetical protein